MLKPKLFSVIKHRDVEITKSQMMNDIIAGIIVAIIALPLSIALAIASGVSPEKGIITAMIAGFLISFLGGSRVQVGGPSATFVILVYGIITQYGIQGLAVTTIMAGLFMIFFGLMNFGGVIKYVPYPITIGFSSSIAVILFSTQIKDFLDLSIENVPTGFIDKWQVYFTNLSSTHVTTLIVALVSLLIIVLWPKINKTIPGSLIALVVVTIGVKVLHLPVETIGSRFGNISSAIGFIDFSSIHITSDLLKELVRPAMMIAILASMESLLSAVIADGMIGKKHNSNMELVAVGIANIVSGLFGGIPATGAIARTAANAKNGGRTPIAGIVHALILLLIMMIFMPLTKSIPMATMSAILIVVSYNMSEWRSFRDLLKSTKSDISVLLVTFLFTIFFDLVIAIEIGMIIAMFLFIRRMSESTQITNVSPYYKAIFCDNTEDDKDSSSDPKDNLHEHLDSHIFLYEINGPLFFGAANMFLEIMNELKSSSSIIIFRMKAVPSMDATAFDVLKRIHKRCIEKHILLLYAEVNEQPMKLITSTGFVSEIGEDRFFADTESAIQCANGIINLKKSS